MTRRNTRKLAIVQPVKQQEPPKLYTIEEMNWTINHKIKYAQAEIEKFQERLKEDPCDAFKWASRAMSAAAEIRVWKMIGYVLNKERRDKDKNEDSAGDMFTNEAKLDSITSQLRYWVNDGCRGNSGSTSGVSNIMEGELAALAWKWFHETYANDFNAIKKFLKQQPEDMSFEA